MAAMPNPRSLSMRDRHRRPGRRRGPVLRRKQRSRNVVSSLVCSTEFRDTDANDYHRHRDRLTQSLPATRHRARGDCAALAPRDRALPLQGGELPQKKFETSYAFPTLSGRKSATVTVRAALGLQSIDEFILWGLLGATLSRSDPQPILMATPYWMLRHLGLDTGGFQYAELRQSLLRLAVTSYQNTGFYNPESKEHEYAAFQFLSMLLPTVGGVGETVDNERFWKIEWNPAFFRFC